MKTIALIGAPGAGKSKLAQAVVRKIEASNPQCESCPRPAIVVDDYAYDTRDAGEYAIGLDGGYMANIDLATTRYRMERKVAHLEPQYMIVCGTIVETAVYTAMHFERTLAIRVKEEDKMGEAARFQACTSMIATLYMDTFKYERAFYLPSPRKPEDERWEAFERNLQAAFQAYSSPIAPLVVEDFKDEDDLTEQRVGMILDEG